MASINFLLSCEWAIFSSSFASLVIFCWKVMALNIIIWHLWISHAPSPLPGFFVATSCHSCCWFSDFFEQVLVKSVFFVVCGHWSLCSANLAGSSWSDWDFLKLLKPTNQPTKQHFSIFAGLHCFRALLQCLSRQLQCLSFHVLLAESLN